MQQLVEQVITAWRSLSRWGQVLLVAAAVLGLVVTGLVFYWAAQPEYRLLFGGLSPEDAATVTSALDRQGVPYKLSSDGTSVYVPADQVTRLRVSLAAEGVGGGSGKGFELFDEAPFGLTPFLEQVNYLRALQAELARTITELDPVVAARVHISRGESSPFAREQKPPTASVVVKLRPGMSLAPSTVRGIVALVAGSVEGLEPTGVSVIDSSGRVLFGGQDAESLVPTTILDYKKSLEEYLSKKAEEMLSHLLGPGRAVVRVSAELDLTEQEEVRETYDPEGKVVRTQSITTKKETGESKNARGIPGVASNVPGVSGGAAGNQGRGQTSQEETITNEYEVSRTTTTVRDHVGEIKRLTVAVLVDLPDQADQGGAGSASSGTSTGITIKDVEEVVKNAVGFDESRDSITVTATNLASARMQEQLARELEAAQAWQWYMSLVRYGALALACLAALVAAWAIGRRVPGGSKPAEENVAGGTTEEPEGGAEQVTVADLSERVRRDPEAVARVIEQWLQEEAA